MKNLIFKSDKIFIAGATGMVGNAIKKNLVKSNYGDISFGGKLLIPTRKELDLLDFNSLKEWFIQNKPDVVIIAAAKVGGIKANSINPSEFLLDNLKIQTNLIELSFLFGVRRLVFLGSSCIYPKFAPQPIKEEYLLSGALEGTNEWYAIAKIAGIKLCQALRIQKGFDAISVMPTNLYGPNDNYNSEASHVMAAFIRKFYEAKFNNLKKVICWGSGAPLREFLHVDDLAEAVKFLLEKWNPPFENGFLSSENNSIPFLNIGTGKEISIKSLAEKIAQKFEYKGEIIWDMDKPDGTPRKLLDINKIRSLGWEPKIPLDKGLDLTIKDFHQELKNGNIRY